MRNKNKLVFGVGINDVDYVVHSRVNGKQVVSQSYRKWKNMLKRCYSEKYQAKYPTYVGCTVCDEWLTYSNFEKWMETQDWVGRQLDKDLLTEGNKVYSPTTCVFVDHMTNSFVVDCRAGRGEWPIGVCFEKKNGKFKANCSNPFTGKMEHLGMFTCPEQAHRAWLKRKHELALQLADTQSDERVAKALRERYALNIQQVSKGTNYETNSSSV